VDNTQFLLIISTDVDVTERSPYLTTPLPFSPPMEAFPTSYHRK